MINSWYKTWFINAFILFTLNFDPTKSGLIRLDVCTFGETIWILSGVVLCCCSSSALWFDMMHWSFSVDLSCNKCVFEMLFPFYKLKPVWLFSHDLWQGISTTELLLNECFIFCLTISFKPCRYLRMNIPVVQQFLKYSSSFLCSVWTSTNHHCHELLSFDYLMRLKV